MSRKKFEARQRQKALKRQKAAQEFDALSRQIKEAVGKGHHEKASRLRRKRRMKR